MELAILGLLKEQDLHGYEIRRRLGDIFGPVVRLSFGTLYPALKRLETRKAVEVLAVSQSRTGLTTTRGRKVYGITERGQQLFSELIELGSVNDDDRAFALRLAFAQYLTREARIRLLIRRREQLSLRLADVRRSLSVCRDQIDCYRRALLEHRNEVAESDISWLDRLIAAEQQSLSGEISAEIIDQK